MAHNARRIVSLAVLTAVVVAGCGSTPKPGAASGTPSAASTNAAAATGKGISSSQVVSLLAGAGIATVAKVTSTAATVPVNGKPVMTFTTDQVDAMAAAAGDHAGLLGSVLDAAHPTPAGDPSYSYLLAAWVSKGTSPGAAEVRAVMGAQNWDQAPSIVFPALALPLFAADVIRAAGSPSRSTPSAPASVMQPASLVSSPCSLVSNFISEVLDTVAKDLMLASPSGSGVDVAVGSFFVDLWNTAVGLAHLAIKNLIELVKAPVLKTIETVAAMAAVIAEVVTNITPWTVAVTASPASVERGAGGSFIAKVSSGLGLGSYPSAITDCAGVLKITLPSLTAAASPATWSLGGPLVASGPIAGSLDATGSSTVSFRTGGNPVNPSCAGGSGPGPSPATGSGTITVSRPAINDLKTLVSNLLSTSIPIAGGVVASILQPLVDEVLGKIDTLSQLTGTGYVHVTSPTGSGTGNCPPAGGVCMVGAWRALIVDISNHGHGSLVGGRGSRWTITPTGHETIRWDGSSPFLIGGEPQFSYLGSSTETVQLPAAGASSGRWSAHVDTDDITARYSEQLAEITGVNSVAVPSDAGISDSGHWTCSPGMLNVTANADGSTITVELRNTP